MKQVLGLHRKVEEYAHTIVDLSKISIDKAAIDAKSGKYIPTSLSSAELIKVTANAFLALKISFANSIAKLSDQVGADINEVMDGVGHDRRIGRAFLNAGRGYGGGCFPKDVSGLIASAVEHGVDMPIMTAATDVNESMPGYIVNKVKERVRSLHGKKVAILGLAFKAGTSDARKSPAVTIANYFASEGAVVTATDPQAIEEAREELHSSISINPNLQDTLQEQDIIVIATDWPEYQKIEFGTATVVDCMNSYQMTSNYIGVGK